MNWIKRARPWEWVVFAVSLGCLLYAFGCLHGCAGVKSAVDPLAEHSTQVGIGTAVGTGVGLLAGATGWGLLAAAAGASIAVIFSTPNAVAGPGSPAPSPMFSLVQYVIFGAILYVIWIRRARVMDALRSRGDPKMMLKQLAHAFLGTSRPGETR